VKILLAEDEAVARDVLQVMLAAQGHDVTTADDGIVAWGLWRLTRHRVVVADWLMPEMDGLELCRKIRAHAPGPYTYFILQTIRSGRASFLEAMDAGVDDFITKPIVPEELVARLNVAQRILGHRQELITLEGLLPICSYCKRLRDDHENWIPLERYVEARSTAQFSHGICPECYDKHVKPQLET
jgi:DNA-binding response OmpR family regulator